jgi:succinoglycan biosynthesis protein ExoA
VNVVTLIIPTFQEEAAIGECLDRVRRQSYVDLQVLVADGGSTDGTRAVVARAAEVDPRIELVDNPRRLQSAGLNEALAKAEGDVVVRLDARSFVGDDYVARTVEMLQETGAAVVGGRMVARRGTSAVARGIAAANGAWWGAGPARFHGQGAAGPADTVYLGTFRRSWLDPSLTVGYQPRGTFRAVAKQYFRYGRSKAAVMRRHPDSIRLRQAVPAGLALVGLFAVLPGRWGRIGRLGVLSHALLVVTLGGRSGGSPTERAAAVAAGWLMHWSWSTGVWFGTVRPLAPAGS